MHNLHWPRPIHVATTSATSSIARQPGSPGGRAAPGARQVVDQPPARAMQSIHGDSLLARTTAAASSSTHRRCNDRDPTVLCWQCSWIVVDDLEVMTLSAPPAGTDSCSLLLLATAPMLHQPHSTNSPLTHQPPTTHQLLTDYHSPLTNHHHSPPPTPLLLLTNSTNHYYYYYHQLTNHSPLTTHSPHHHSPLLLLPPPTTHHHQPLTTPTHPPLTTPPPDATLRCSTRVKRESASSTRRWGSAACSGL